MRHSTWILLAAVLAVGAFIGFWERRQPSTDEAQASQKKLLDLRSKDVTAMERSGQGPLALKRSGEDKWEIMSPVKDAADAYGADGFLDRLAQTQVLRWAGAGDAKALGLEPPRAVWRLDRAGGAIRLEVGAKAPLGEGLYVRVGGKVAVVPAEMESLLLQPLSGFRLKTLTTTATQEVQSFVLLKGTVPQLAFQRSEGAWQVTVPFQDWGAEEKLEALLDDVSLCPVDHYVEDSPKDLKAFGLEPAATTMRLVLAGGRSEELRLGAPVPGADPQKRLVYAWASDRPSVMAVSLNSVKSLDQDPQALRSTALFRHDFFDVQKVTFAGKHPAVLERGKDGGWLFVEPKTPPKGADAGTLAGALQSLRAAEVLPLGAPDAQGLAKPELTISVKGRGFEERLAVGTDVGGRRYARPAARQAVVLLPKEAWTRLDEALAVATRTPLAATK